MRNVWQIHHHGYRQFEKIEPMEILNYDEQPLNSYALAIFDVALGSGLVLGRIKVCRSKNGHLYLQRPSFKKGELNGKPNWAPYDYFVTPEKEKDFNKSVLDLLKPFLDRSISR